MLEACTSKHIKSFILWNNNTYNFKMYNKNPSRNQASQSFIILRINESLSLQLVLLLSFFIHINSSIFVVRLRLLFARFLHPICFLLSLTFSFLSLCSELWLVIISGILFQDLPQKLSLIFGGLRYLLSLF